MRRVSITKLFAMLPHSDSMTVFSLSKSSATPFTKLHHALFVRLDSPKCISLELAHGRSAEVLCIRMTAPNGAEFTKQDAILLRRLVTDIQKEWGPAVIAKPVLYAFLNHLLGLADDRMANGKDLHTLIRKQLTEDSSGWWNH